MYEKETLFSKSKEDNLPFCRGYYYTVIKKVQMAFARSILHEKFCSFIAIPTRVQHTVYPALPIQIPLVYVICLAFFYSACIKLVHRVTH